MLWYKSWLETRWRFLIGVALLACSAIGTVFAYPQLMKLMPLVPAVDLSGEIGRQIRESAELAREYRGYIRAQWFRQSLPQMWTIFAALLGTSSVFSPERGLLFTLSLPVSRERLLGVRAAAGLGELLVLTFVPSLLIPLFSPAIGKSYSAGDILIHSACLFVAGAVFFSLAFLLSTLFSDLWRPLLLTLLAAVVLALCGQVFRELSLFGIFRVMSAEVYFRAGELPWIGLLASAVASAGMLYGAAINIAHRDF